VFFPTVGRRRRTAFLGRSFNKNNKNINAERKTFVMELVCACFFLQQKKEKKMKPF